MKSLVVINFNNQNPFNFDLSNFEFEVKHFNYETHQVGKYFNKFEEEVLDELKIPAVFYVCSGMIDGKEMFWVDKIEDCINRSKKTKCYYSINLL